MVDLDEHVLVQRRSPVARKIEQRSRAEHLVRVRYAVAIRVARRALPAVILREHARRAARFARSVAGPERAFERPAEPVAVAIVAIVRVHAHELEFGRTRRLGEDAA